MCDAWYWYITRRALALKLYLPTDTAKPLLSTLAHNFVFENCLEARLLQLHNDVRDFRYLFASLLVTKSRQSKRGTELPLWMEKVRGRG